MGKPHIYKVRAVATKSNGTERSVFGISIPRDVGEKLAGQNFSFEVTDEGMLFRPVETPDYEADWMNG